MTNRRTTKFYITYEWNELRYLTEWYGSSEESVRALFKMWHPHVKVIEVTTRHH